MKNEAHFFIDTSGTLSNKVQFFVQHKNYYGLLFMIAAFYNLLMNKTENKTRILVWGAILSTLSYFLFAPQANIRTPKKGAK